MKFNTSLFNMTAIYATRTFDKLLDKATNIANLDPDWTSILQLCDAVRQNDITPKYAILAIKRKLHSHNPHQVFYTLLILESMVKNCGSVIHDEVATKSFTDTLHERLAETTNDRNKNKMLDLIQAWAIAFRKIPKYRPIQDMMNIIKAEGYIFPKHNESEAMFSAQTAPKFLTGDICHRCRVPFSLILRRHHCRACGQPFCQQCSPNTTILPQFGIEKEVRVCENCYDKYATPCSSKSAKKSNFSLAYKPKNNVVTTKPSSEVSKRTEELKLQEEDDLQLAMALSKSEAEHKEIERQTKYFSAKPPSRLKPPLPKLASKASAPSPAVNLEMNHYLDRQYWEKRAASVPTAPLSTTPQTSAHFCNTLPIIDYDDLEDKDIDKFIEILRSQIEIFINRMKSDSSRGRHISNDSSVQGLFINITAMHSKLLQFIEKVDDKRVYLESLQDKVSQVRDCRAALDLLRTEHTAHLAAVQKTELSIKQSQMAAKLALLRQKKQDYLLFQRQLALQRVQEHEREMHMRQQQSYIANNHYAIGSSISHMPNNYLNRTSQGNFTWRNNDLSHMTTDALQNEQPSVSRLNLARSFNQKEKLPNYTTSQVTNAHNCTKLNYKDAKNQPDVHLSQVISPNPNVPSSLSQQMLNPGLAAQQMRWIPYQQGPQQTQNISGNPNQNANICQQNINYLQQEQLRSQTMNQTFPHNINNNFTNSYDPATGILSNSFNQQNPSYSMDMSNRRMSQYNPLQTVDNQQPRMSNHCIRLPDPLNSSSCPNQIMQDQYVNTPNNYQYKTLTQHPKEFLPEQQHMNIPAHNQNPFLTTTNMRSKSDTQAINLANQNIAQQDLQGNYQIPQMIPSQNVFRQLFSQELVNPQSNIQQNQQPNDNANLESILKKQKVVNLPNQQNFASHQNITQYSQNNVQNPTITSQVNANLQQYPQNNSNLINREKSSCDQQNLVQQIQLNQPSMTQGYTTQASLINHQNADHVQITFGQPTTNSMQQGQVSQGQSNVVPSNLQDRNKTQSRMSFVQPQKNQNDQHTIPKIQQMPTCGMPPILQILNNAQEPKANFAEQGNMNQLVRQQPGIMMNQQKIIQNQNTQGLQIDKGQIQAQNTIDKTQMQLLEKPRTQHFHQASTTRLQQGALTKMQSQVSHQGAASRPLSSPSQVLSQPQQPQHSLQSHDLQNVKNNAGMQIASALTQNLPVNTDHNDANPNNNT